MFTRFLLVGLMPAGLLISACGNDPKTVPADASGRASSDYAKGYDALQRGDSLTAIAYLRRSHGYHPADPFEELNLAAAYQNAGMIEMAMPLYRNVIAHADGVYGTQYTKPEVSGLSIAGVARWNLAQIGRDTAGILIMTRMASLPAPNEMKYQVFFRTDSADVTSEGAAVVREAARNAIAGNPVDITVAGHANTIGREPDNPALSERRATAVERALTADGVPPRAMQAHGVGKASLRVPTAAGVEKPESRRVESDAREAQLD